ncbi:unnamed protein product [Alopecurus aequalis]
MSIVRRGPSSRAAPPLEDEDLLSEVLLRLPPQPSSLPRASAVCKLWRSIASDPGFSRRFRRHHRQNPPLLGFFYPYSGHKFHPTLDPPNHVPPGRFSLQHDDGDRFISLGCRHGLVLMLESRRKHVLVWDPVTGDQHLIALPPWVGAQGLTNGAVLRAAGDVHHFQLVMVVSDNHDQLPRLVRACVYSSVTSLWGNLVSTLLSPSNTGFPPSNLFPMPAVLVGDSLYWTLVGSYTGILAFDLERQTLAVIQVPAGMSEECGDLTVMRAQGGGLGFLFVSDAFLHAQLWERKTDCDGAASWVLGRTFELEKLLSLDSKMGGWPITIRGFAEHNNVVMLSAINGLFMVQLESLHVKKLNTIFDSSCRHAFENVYAAGAHFRVVLVGGSDEKGERVLACIYSSETGVWGNFISTPLDMFFSSMPAVLVGNSLYWLMLAGSSISLKFDLDNQSLAVAALTVDIYSHTYIDMFVRERCNATVMRAEGGEMGLLIQTDFTVQLWMRKTNCDGVASWVLQKTIELDKLLRLNSEKESLHMVGFAEENNVMFLWTIGAVFMVQLETLQFKELFKSNKVPEYHPFEVVYAGNGIFSLWV